MIFWVLGALGLLAFAGKRSPAPTPMPVAVYPTHEAFAPDDPPRVRMLSSPRYLRAGPAMLQETWRLTNEVRSRGACGYPPAKALKWSGELARAAQAHAEDMHRQSYFSHASLDGRTPSQRMLDAGYPTGRALGENIASGQTSPAQVVDGWEHSPGHCRNMLDPNYRFIGLGFAGGVWVQNFGG